MIKYIQVKNVIQRILTPTIQLHILQTFHYTMILQMHVGIFAFNMEISVKHLKFMLKGIVDFINKVVPHKQKIMEVLIITLHHQRRFYLWIYEMYVRIRKIITQIRPSEILVVESPPKRLVLMTSIVIGTHLFQKLLVNIVNIGAFSPTRFTLQVITMVIKYIQLKIVKNYVKIKMDAPHSKLLNQFMHVLSSNRAVLYQMILITKQLKYTHYLHRIVVSKKNLNLHR